MNRLLYDHVEFKVRSLTRSLPFYREALQPLGFTLLAYDETTLSAGFGKYGWSALLVQQSTASVPPMHIAFAAASPQEVIDFYRNAMANGGTDNGPPNPRPEYGPNYYAAFVLDPDGHNIEAIFRGPAPSSS